MPTGHTGSNPPRLFPCELCSKEFLKKWYPSQNKPRFCSVQCRNKHNSQAIVLKKISCPICGTPFKPYKGKATRKKFCSVACACAGRRAVKHSENTKDMVKLRYPSEGAQKLAPELGLSISAVQCIAYRLGVKLNPEVFRKRVHGAAREHMLKHNPMRRANVRKKVNDFWQATPERRTEALARSISASRANQQKHPSGLERKLWQILDSSGVEYESQVIIKPKFIVDIRIGNLIIQADGDYWHGHQRFAPLTDRQLRQQRRDKAQDKYLAAAGYTVVRVWESDMNPDTVLSVLKEQEVLQ